MHAKKAGGVDMDGLSTSDLEFIDSVYRAIETPGHFEQILEAWDSVIAEAEQNHDNVESFRERSKRLFYKHFDHALHLFELYLGSEQDPISLVNSQTTAALVSNIQGQVVAVNALATQITGLSIRDTIDELPFEGEGLSKLHQALRDGFDGALIVRGFRTDTNKILIFVIESVFLRFGEQHAQRFLLMKTTETIWHPSMNTILSAAFKLTQTECQLIEALNAGQTLQTIAENRGRSLQTVRTQVNNILQKTNSHSREALLKSVTGLLHIIPDVVTPVTGAPSVDQSLDISDDNGTSRIYDLHDGRKLEYVTLGAPLGRPVLLLMPTTPPIFPQKFIQNLHDHNISVIVPIKPGAKGSSDVPNNWGPDELGKDYFELMKARQYEQFAVAGHCSGGVYAMKFARRYPGNVTKLLLIDTGAPIQSLSQITKMPKAPKRTFFAARFSPQVLLVPHKMAATNFFRSREEADNLINYFYSENDADVRALRNSGTKKYAYDMIAYSFENIGRLVNDIKIWAQDWSSELDFVAQDHDIFFLHGSENHQFPISDLHQLAKNYETVFVLEVANIGQLLIHEAIESVADAICNLWDSKEPDSK